VAKKRKKKIYHHQDTTFGFRQVIRLGIFISLVFIAINYFSTKPKPKIDPTKILGTTENLDIQKVQSNYQEIIKNVSNNSTTKEIITKTNEIIKYLPSQVNGNSIEQATKNISDSFIKNIKIQLIDKVFQTIIRNIEQTHQDTIKNIENNQ